MARSRTKATTRTVTPATPAKRKYDVSPAVTAACRANAQLSTGPRSADGLRRSSMNALKHATYAETIFLEHESPDDYQALVDLFVASLGADDPLQRLLA